METKATQEKHWLVYWWPGLAIFGAFFALLLLVAVAGSKDRARAAGDGRAREESAAVDALRLAAMPCSKLERADAEWAGLNAKDALAFAVALAGLDPYCAENQEQIAAATIAAQKRLGAEGFRTSSFDIMDTIYRQTQKLRVGWSYTALVDDYARGYAEYGAAAAERAIPNLLRYPDSKP